MKKLALAAGLMLISTMASPKPISFEIYNPLNKRAKTPIGVVLPTFFYSKEKLRAGRAKPKKEEGYKPMPLREGGPAQEPQAIGIASEKKMPPRIPNQMDAHKQMMYRSAWHGRHLC